MPRVDLRAVTDASRLEEVGAIEVFLPALVFLTGFLLIGAETPLGALFSTSNGSWTAASWITTPLLPLALAAVVFFFFEALAGESLLGVSLFLDLLDYPFLVVEVPTKPVLLPLLDATFLGAGT